MQRRALIVDDDPAICRLIERVLTSVGIDALALTQSAEAPPILEQLRFDIAFLDFHMESPDGPELTRQMRGQGPNSMTPVVLISDDQDPHAMQQGFSAGASFFLYKPVDKDRVLRLVRADRGKIEHERRRTRRVPMKSKIQVRAAGEVIEGETVDISMEGVLVKAAKTAPVGSSVDVRLHLSHQARPIIGSGAVVRLLHENQMGIHLARMPFAESQRLQEFLLPFIPD